MLRDSCLKGMLRALRKADHLRHFRIKLLKRTVGPYVRAMPRGTNCLRGMSDKGGAEKCSAALGLLRRSEGWVAPVANEALQGVELDVGARVRRFRADRAWTLGRLAGAAGLSEGHLSRIEGGSRTPSVGSVMAIAKALNLHVGELLGEQREAPRYTIRRDPQEGGPLQRMKPRQAAPRAEQWALLEASRLHLAPEDAVRSTDHEGERFVMIIKGAAWVHLAQEWRELRQGDSIHLGPTPRAISIIASGGWAEVLLITTPR